MASEADRWDDPDEGGAEGPFESESAIGARVDPDLANEPDGSDEPEPELEPDPAGPSPGARPGQREPASFWRRLGAYVVDSFVLTLPTNLLIELVMGEPFPTEVDFTAPAQSLEVLWPFAAIAFGLEIAYFSAMEASRLQATIGKHLLKIQVTDTDGQPVSFPRALARNAAKLASAIPFGLGFLMIFTSRDNQALHDHIARCLVPKREDEPDREGPEGWQP